VNKKLLVVIVGPTAVGKTEIAIEVAQKLSTEIVSADSMQIYRYMDIGTAKPSTEEQKRIKHHMIDIVDPNDDFSAADFQLLAKNCIEKIHKRCKIPILTGGTGFYINSVCYDYTFSEFERDDILCRKLGKQAQDHGNDFLYNKLLKLDPVAAEKIHPNNLRRVIRALEVCIKTGNPFSHYEEKTKRQETPYRLIMCGLTRPREELYQRINDRVLAMFDQGFLEEVKHLINMGFEKSLNSMQGLGYRQIIDIIDGKISKQEAIELIARDTRRYAKRQYTWFKRDKNIIWYDVSKEGKKGIIAKILGQIEGISKES